MAALGWRDLTLALLVTVIWGIAFVATRIGLDDFSPPQLTALRFVIAALPVAFLPRPTVSWAAIVTIGITLFTGQFLFQFFGIAGGLPPGLASVIVQTQALFTVLFAAAALGERPSRRQVIGMTAALAGVLLIAVTVGQSLTAVGLMLGLLSAVSWGIGNVLLKRLGPVDMLGLMVWLGPGALVRALWRSSWAGLAAVLYLGLVATTFAYALWGGLLRRYPTATVAPFALLVPFVAALYTWLIFGERFGPVRLAGMAFVLLGLVLVALPSPLGSEAVGGHAS